MQKVFTMTTPATFDPLTLTFNEAGLIPAIAQDADSNEVLMMAWMNADAIRKTLQTGRVTYWSRSRQSFWTKGESSGHEQHVVSIHVDCDGDALLLKVRQDGGACHEGYRTCFYRKATDQGDLAVTETRVFDPGAVYGSGG